MVSGHTQAIDSAPVKANASMDSLELKVPAEELDEHIRRVRKLSSNDQAAYNSRKARTNKADKEQQIITASKQELQEIESRTKKWTKDQDSRPGASSESSRYTE